MSNKIMNLLVEAWNEFNKLEQTHPDHLNDFRAGIHKCQSILMWKELQELKPDKYPIYKASKTLNNPLTFTFNTPFISPGCPEWAKPMPNPTDVGRKVKVIKGQYAGKTGTIIEHWMNCDDCSGGYGLQLYQLDTHNFGTQNNSYGINVEHCEFID